MVECGVELEREDEEVLRIDDYGYVIRACCGPQDIELRVWFKRREGASKVEISISICVTEATMVTYFDWEAWRNGFYGR